LQQSAGRSNVISLLLVDPDVTAAAALVGSLPASVDLDVRADFPPARARLHAQPPRLLVTALRLREYNGLHLVYLAARAGCPREASSTPMIPTGRRRPKAERQARSTKFDRSSRSACPPTSRRRCRHQTAVTAFGSIEGSCRAAAGGHTTSATPKRCLPELFKSGRHLS